jgi:tRNA(Ile)-lysidine synthase
MRRNPDPSNDRLPQRVLAAVREHELIQPGERALVAVSGGIDSVVLLRILADASPLLGATVRAAHLNHGLRGPESDADEEFVRGLCTELGVPLDVETARGLKADKRGNIEEAAREARTEFLLEAAARGHAGKIALGHTADDQVETFLLNLLRGSGLDGLTAMPHISQDGFVRPLLGVWRSEIAEFAARESIEHREDSSNLDTGLARNRIRHRLLPSLAEDYNPQVKRRILRTIGILKAESEVIEAVARKAFDRLATQGDGGVLLDAAGFGRLELGIARRVARMALEQTVGTLRDVESVHIEGLVGRLASRAPGRFQVPGVDIELTEQAPKMLMARYVEPPEPITFEYELDIPGSVEVREAGATITGSVYARAADAPTNGERAQIAIDLGKVEGRLQVRSRRPGDRIAPLGMGGHTKSVSDVLTDGKVPNLERPRLCLVCDERKVIWVAGQAVSELVRVTAQTGKVLVLRLIRSQAGAR